MRKINKKLFAAIAVLSLVILVLALTLPRSNTNSADAVIASDYSTVTYNKKVYVPIGKEMLPSELDGMEGDTDMIKATVEGENYFLDKYFLTNLISVREYDGDTFIYLHTDYDDNESNYYCSQSYKEKINYEY